MAKKKVISDIERFPKREIKRQKFVVPDLSRSQAILKEMFSGNEMWGTGRDLPKLNRALTSGRGIIKSGDAGETGSMFGI